MLFSARRSIVLSLTGIICLAAAACSQTVAPAGVKGAGQEPFETVAFDEANPMTWKLPMEAYLPSDAEQAQLRKASTALTHDCVRKSGNTAWTPAPALPKLGPKTLTDWRYGIHDQGLSAKRGYHPDLAEQAAYDAALRVGLVDGTDVLDPATLSSCGRQAAEALGGGQKTYGELAQRLANEAFIRSKQEPEVAEKFKQWSACMKESGRSYKEPLDASDDSRFTGSDVTQPEIDTALADLACRGRTGVAKTWFDAEARLQKAAQEQNAQALRAERGELDRAIKKAAGVLAGGK
ncbi:hypothetical protein KCMC57_up00570 [Kitasatospora sp. CMC57]|uniref:Lipoprotein n=1 Tax=Kitasatospora sp. CMC57 TaxID=3231513 RepID=A0AB33JVA6_9ACTN